MTRPRLWQRPAASCADTTTNWRTSSKLVGYGNNRADYTFIPAGMIPGVVIIQPDFPELKDNWPFLWYENEYVVDAATASSWQRTRRKLYHIGK
jgi:endoglucanase